MGLGPLKYGLVYVPKFSFDSTVKMEKGDALVTNLGLDFLFDEQTADFSPMGTEKSDPTVVGIIKQNTRVELDENGVKAAAVTIVGGFAATSVHLDPPLEFTMVVDKPFFFYIVSEKTGTLLFTGTVNKL
jgi:serpin B